MPKMKPGKNQGNIDKKALAKQTDPDDELFPYTSGIQDLNEVTIFAPSKQKKDPLTNPNEIGEVVKVGDPISSGGEGDPEVKLKTKNEFGDDFLYGSNRFNKLWSLYNEVKDKPGIENNPEYHRLIKKLTRKMPRTIKNLNRNVENSLEKRKKIHEKLNPGVPMDLKSEEVVQNVKDRVNKFIENPFYVKPEPEVENNENKGNTNNDLVKTTVPKRGPYLAPRLGMDIKKSLKNFR
tara:strand:+ start:2651 stop:3358 length:708 start_codon:yes stop_codon:yes gene_type:complete